jgi:membrane protease YdiL (CAAX protease family)
MMETPQKNQSHLSKGKFLVGLSVIYLTAYSQYLLPNYGLIFGLLFVYGLPILIITGFWGRHIIQRSLNRMFDAIRYGLASYGGFTGLSYLVTFLLTLLLLIFDPSAFNILHRPNPVLNTSPEHAWTMVWISLLIVGPAEEFIFRGFIYGGLLNIFSKRHWLWLAFLSSVLFASVHLYYAFVYGIVSVLMFTQLIAFGMAMAVSYYLSNGNLLVPAFIHGLFDAFGFLSSAVSLELGATLRYDLFFISLVIFGIVIMQRIWIKKPI